MSEVAPPSSPLDEVVVVLVEPQNVVNIAGCVRAMKNFGLSRLRLVNPAEFSPYRIEGIAHRSTDLIEATRIFETVEEAVSDAVYLLGTTARPRTAARNYARPRDVAAGVLAATTDGPVAVLFGREDRGLSNEALDRCNAVTIVPTDPDYSSLNLAQACLLVCYELAMHAAEAPSLPRGKRDMGPATQADLEHMYTALEEGLARIDFFKGDRESESVTRTLRTLLARAQPDLREARLVRAIGFEIQHYLDRARDSKSD